MKNRNAYMAIVAAMTLCGLGLTACDPEKTNNTEKEFVCYDDGALVERHVGVEHAVWQAAGPWLIRYKDGQEAAYEQPPGETCQVEEIKIKA